MGVRDDKEYMKTLILALTLAQQPTVRLIAAPDARTTIKLADVASVRALPGGRLLVNDTRQRKLLVVEPYRVDAKDRNKLETTGRTFIAVDSLGAGEGDFVLITQGSSARLTPETKNMPIDTVVVGIVDDVRVDTAKVYSRS